MSIASAGGRALTLRPEAERVEQEDGQDAGGDQGPRPLQPRVVVPVGGTRARSVLVAPAEPGQQQVRDDEDEPRHHAG